MIVEKLMTRKVITVHPEDTVLEALTVARTNRIRHVPVVEGKTLKGIVSDRDLRDVSPSVLASKDVHLLEGTLVKEIMHTDVITASPSDPVEEAARMLYEHRIGSLPVVVDGDQLVGIITHKDVLFCFVEKYHM